MSATISRVRNFVNDKNNTIPITASYMDSELDQLITACNQKAVIKSTAPSSPIAGMLWLDSTNKILKQYRNNEWVCNGIVHVGTAAPTTAQEGDVWYDTTNNVIKSHNGTSFSTGTITHPSSTVQGDVIYYSAADTVARLAAGTADGMALTTQGTGANPTYRPLFDLIGTTGDLLIGNGAKTLQVLTPGTSGQYLQSQGPGSALQWATVTALSPLFGIAADITNTTIYAVGGANAATEDNINIRVPFDCTIGPLYARAAISGNHTVTVYQNGTATALTATNSGTGNFQGTQTISFTAGDRFAFLISTNASNDYIRASVKVVG